MIIDKLMERIGTKTSKESDADGYYTIELTLLSDKGVKWLNEINSIVKGTRIVTAGIVEEMEIDDMLEDLMKQLDESEILYED